MFHAILVDDEKPLLDLLTLRLERSGHFHVLASFQNPQAALSHMKLHEPDVAFLDIEMQGMNGLELAGEMLDAGIRSEIIFATAYDRYALEAFRVNAIDYILKPYLDEDISRVLTKLRKAKNMPATTPSRYDHGRISTFGPLSLFAKGSAEAVAWRTAKAEELFAYMLMHLDQFVGKRKITSTLWPDIDSDKRLASHLHTSIYQVKKTLLEAQIDFTMIYQNGSYRLSLSDCYIDAVEFDRLTDQTQIESDKTWINYSKAVDLYRGAYLDDHDYSWAEARAVEYGVRYQLAVEALVSYYNDQGDLIRIEQLLVTALERFPLSDDFNLMILDLYGQKKDKASLITHYRWIEEQYRSELDITPSRSIQSVYKRQLLKL